MTCAHIGPMYLNEDCAWCFNCGALRLKDAEEWLLPVVDASKSRPSEPAPHCLRGIHLRGDGLVLVRFFGGTGGEIEIFLSRDTGIGVAVFLKLLCEQPYSKKGQNHSEDKNLPYPVKPYRPMPVNKSE